MLARFSRTLRSANKAGTVACISRSLQRNVKAQNFGHMPQRIPYGSVKPQANQQSFFDKLDRIGNRIDRSITTLPLFYIVVGISAAGVKYYLSKQQVNREAQIFMQKVRDFKHEYDAADQHVHQPLNKRREVVLKCKLYMKEERVIKIMSFLIALKEEQPQLFNDLCYKVHFPKHKIEGGKEALELLSTYGVKYGLIEHENAPVNLTEAFISLYESFKSIFTKSETTVANSTSVAHIAQVIKSACVYNTKDGCFDIESPIATAEMRAHSIIHANHYRDIFKRPAEIPAPTGMQI